MQPGRKISSKWWLSDHMCDRITYPFPNFNGLTMLIHVSKGAPDNHPTMSIVAAPPGSPFNILRPRRKWSPICRRHFQMYFFFNGNFEKFLANKQQAIIWINVDQDLWRHVASLGHMTWHDAPERVKFPGCIMCGFVFVNPSISHFYIRWRSARLR